MKMKPMIAAVKKIKYWLVAASLLLCPLCSVLFAQFKLNSAQLITSAYLNDLLPIDSRTKQGKLENGFSYYVRDTDVKTKNITIYFVVKAGTLQEDEKQEGLAHVLEHVAFKGTSNFPNGVYFYLEKLGMSRGSQINAATGYDATIYMLSVPADSVGAVSLALKIARDLGNEALLGTENIEIERQAVIAEYLSGESTVQRELDMIVPNLLGKSCYSSMSVSNGAVGNVKKFKHEELIRYYNTWYRRPELQSIMIAGSVDTEAVVDEIKQIFGGLKKTNGQELLECPVYVKSDRAFATLGEKGQNEITIKMYKRYAGIDLNTTIDLRKKLIATLYNNLVDERFAQTSSEMGEVMSMYHGFQERGLIGLYGMDLLHTTFKVGAVAEIGPQLHSVMKQFYRIEKYGFLDGELALAKERLKKDLVNISPLAPIFWIQAFEENFFHGSAILDQKKKAELSIGLLDKISLGEINKQANEWLGVGEYDIFMTSSEKNVAKLPNRKTFDNYLQSVKKSDPGHYTSKSYEEYKPVEPIDIGAHIVSRNSVGGATVVKLSNGVTILLKKVLATESGDSSILLHGFVNQGASLYSDVKYFSALASPQFISRSEIGGLSRTGFDSYLTRQGIKYNQYVNDYSSGVRGSANAGQFSTLLSMAYQNIVDPPKDNKAFLEWKNTEMRNLSMRGVEDFFRDSIVEVTGEEERIFDKKMLDKINFESSFDIYRRLFSDGKFTFIVVGDFDEGKIIPMLTKYLGAIPSKKEVTIGYKTNHTTDIKRSKVIEANVEATSVEMRMVREAPLKSQEIYKLNVLQWLIDRRLTARLREKDRGVYSVGTHIKLLKYPTERFVLSVSFKCAPAIAASLISSTIQEIDSINRYGIDSDTYNTYLVNLRQKRDGIGLTKKFWMNYLETCYLFDTCKECDENVWCRENEVSVQDISDAARKYLDSKDIMVFKLVPNVSGVINQ